MESRDYEIFIRNFYEALRWQSKSLAFSKFRHNHEYKGLSRKWKVDVSYSFSAVGMKIKVFIECKHWNKKVGVNVISRLQNCISDCGAHKGAVVTTVGYTSGAIKTAKKHGIALIILTDDESFSLVKEPESKYEYFNTEREINSYGNTYSPDGDKKCVGIVYPKADISKFIESRLGKKITKDFINKRISGYSPSQQNKILQRIGSYIRKFDLIESGGLPVQVAGVKKFKYTISLPDNISNS